MIHWYTSILTMQSQTTSKLKPTQLSYTLISQPYFSAQLHSSDSNPLAYSDHNTVHITNLILCYVIDPTYTDIICI